MNSKNEAQTAKHAIPPRHPRHRELRTHSTVTNTQEMQKNAPNLYSRKKSPKLQTFLDLEIPKRLTNNVLRNSRSSENSAKVCKTLLFLQSFSSSGCASPRFAVLAAGITSRIPLIPSSNHKSTVFRPLRLTNAVRQVKKWAQFLLQYQPEKERGVHCQRYR